MGIDLNKPIGKSARGASRNVYPTKNTMNLAMSDAAAIDWGKQIPLIILVALLVICFAKFAVIDPLSAASAQRAVASRAQAELNTVRTQLSGYDALETEYLAYTGAAKAQGDTADPVKVLSILDTVSGDARVSSLSLDGYTLKVEFSDVGLDRMAAIVSQLEANDQVDSVTMTTAQGSSADTADVSASITVQLAHDTAAGKEAAK